MRLFTGWKIVSASKRLELELQQARLREMRFQCLEMAIDVARFSIDRAGSEPPTGTSIVASAETFEQYVTGVKS